MNDNILGKLPLKIIVPLTDWKDRYEIAPWMVKIKPGKKNGLAKDSAADCFQIRSISEQRFVKKIGLTDDVTLDEIKIGISKVLTIN